MKTLFSVIIPTYNRGYRLWKTIQSVQDQSYPNWELLVVDDGSTDDTKKVVAQFQSDPRIKYLYQKNSGESAARNLGLKNSQGDIITYLDSDDYFYPNCLEVVLEFFKKFPKKVFTIPNYNRRLELYDKNYQLVDFTEVSSAQKDQITLQDYYHWKVKTCGSGIFHKKEANKKVRWDINLKLLQDWDFIMQLGNSYPDGFLHIPFALFEYPQQYGGDAICSNTTYLEWSKGFEAIWKKHRNDLLMKGQDWYPDRVEKYKKLDAEFKKGKYPSPILRYFPKAKI